MSKLFFYIGVLVASLLFLNSSDLLIRSLDKNKEGIVEQEKIDSNGSKAS